MEKLKKVNSIKGLLIIIVILSAIMYGLLALAKSNILTHKNTIEKIESLEEVGERFKGIYIPSGITEDELISIELYEDTGMLHILCKNSELLLEPRDLNIGYIEELTQGMKEYDIKVDGIKEAKYINNDKKDKNANAVKYIKGEYNYLLVMKGNITKEEAIQFVKEK